MPVCCPQCHAALSPDDLRVIAPTALCHACGEAFAPSRSAAAAGPGDRAVEGPEGGTVVSVRPARQGVLQGVACGTIAGVIGVGWTTTTLWVLQLFSLAFFLIALGFVYQVLGQLFNVTHLRLDARGLEVTTRPLPRGRPVREPLDRIDGFGVFDASSDNSSGPPTIDWQLQILRTTGGPRPIALGLQSPTHAQHVAYRLNAALAAVREAQRGYRG